MDRKGKGSSHEYQATIDCNIPYVPTVILSPIFQNANQGG